MRINNFLKLVISIGISESAGIIGSTALTTGGSSNAWYGGLAKPALNPPDWVFGPVWIVLYALMGIALWLIWSFKETEDQKKTGYKTKAISLFIAQLTLNALWSPVFFGYHSIGNALVIIVLLWAAVVLTIFIFSKISKVAACLLLPYILWIGFAGYLNYSIWRLNTVSEPTACTMDAKLCSDGSYVGRSGPKCEFSACPKEDLIRVFSPIANEEISSPLAISGEARGLWFFEASFPVILVDWDGKIIAQGIATAQNEWMTENFVPFKAELEFEKPKFIGDFSKHGALIFRKDNPSGLPQHDDALEMPIIFK